jgi:hypothetical protein
MAKGEANARAVANIRTAHRTDIACARRLAMAMLQELESVTGNADLFEELGRVLRSEDDQGQDRRNDIYRKVISSAGRIDSMKKLADTLKTLIVLEREAYGIVDVQKIDINARIASTHKPQDMTDDELFAIATGSGAGTADPAQGARKHSALRQRD